METFANTVTIDRPAKEVFAFLADFENVPRWNYAIDKTWKTSPGPVAVGTTYRQTRSIPSRSEEGFEVTAFELGKRLAVRGQIGPFGARISSALVWSPQVISSTRLAAGWSCRTRASNSVPVASGSHWSASTRLT